MCYVVKLHHDAAEANKNIYVKGEGAVDHSNQMVEEILLRL